MKNIELLNRMLEERYVVCQKHPTAELYIYNYSPKVQYSRLWNEITIACRGLILDGDGNVIARPFPKFFNLGEYENQLIPNKPFEVYEKMDGSLGISYVLNEEIYIATRGSFTSDQSKRANQILRTKYSDSIIKMDKNITYLFEIIYPENRIVVDYGMEEKLVLLAMIDTKSGQELDLVDIGIPVVEQHHTLTDIQALKTLEEDNKEGFVIKYKNGYRLKVKFEEYVRLHRIITQVSSISIWEYLKTQQPMDDLLAQIPDEVYDWVRKTKAELENQYTQIEKIALSEMKVFNTRKESAEHIMKCRYPTVMFKMLDKKDYSETIWNFIRPEYQKPFSIKAED